MTPTQLSKRELEKHNYLVEITERWNAFARKRKDLFDFIDLLAIKKGEILGIQTTSASNIHARIKKITEHENYPAVRDSGIKIVVHGWYKEKNRWKVKIKEL
ncbi:MAG TPA: hypothetical protein VGD26_10785 [Chitinophagaceae bacterium]